MSITVNNLSKHYGSQKALNEVSFSLKQGEIVGFLGPNGAGKSTMMKILTCYLPQTSGDASVAGLNVREQSMAIRQKVGYLPEHNPLYLDMYVREFLGFIAGIHHVNKARIDEIIRQVGLQPEQHKKLGQLSKGYRQRAGLAAALLHDPEVLILDEPTTGLDPNQLVEIRNLIRKIGKEKTVMLSTHIMQEVEELCSRVIIIHNGAIVTDRPTQDLKNLSGSKVYQVEFDQEMAAGQLKKIAGVQQVMPLEGFRWEISARPGTGDIRPEIFKFAVERKATVLEIRQQEQKLEQIFQQLTE